MQNALNIMLVITSCALIVLVLMQGGSSKGLSRVISGSNSELSLFSDKKTHGLQKVIKRTTLILGVVFFILVVISRLG